MKPPDVHGVVVSGIDPGSPAAQYLSPGDIILSVNRQPVNSVADFNRLAAEAKGRTLLRIIHGGQPISWSFRMAVRISKARRRFGGALFFSLEAKSV